LALAIVCGGCEQEFSVKKVSPAVGVIGGGEPVDILGSGFQPGMGITIYFGTTRVEKVVVRGSEKITVNTPSANEAKVVDVRVVTDDGKEFVLRDAFRYVTKSNMDIRDLGQRKSLRESE
ncbi:MAG TPA: IPT/TIG domain-containing protein, partial [Polyangia bacterium]|nr:IPT/TIG domain-containing protein [Polyangia bacterium]